MYETATTVKYIFWKTCMFLKGENNRIWWIQIENKTKRRTCSGYFAISYLHLLAPYSWTRIAWRLFQVVVISNLLIWVFTNRSRVPRRVLVKCVTRLGLNDGAKLWISTFFLDKYFIACIREKICLGATFEENT